MEAIKMNTNKMTTSTELLLPLVPVAGWFIVTVLLLATTVLAPMWVSIGWDPGTTPTSLSNFGCNQPPSNP
jgi:hypothetical protein